MHWQPHRRRASQPSPATSWSWSGRRRAGPEPRRLPRHAWCTNASTADEGSRTGPWVPFLPGVTELEGLLARLVEVGGTDLVVKAGSAPHARVDARLQPVGDGPLDQDGV